METAIFIGFRVSGLGFRGHTGAATRIPPPSIPANNRQVVGLVLSKEQGNITPVQSLDYNFPFSLKKTSKFRDSGSPCPGACS